MNDDHFINTVQYDIKVKIYDSEKAKLC